jgi:hypothetical protein
MRDFIDVIPPSAGRGTLEQREVDRRQTASSSEARLVDPTSFQVGLCQISPASSCFGKAEA